MDVDEKLRTNFHEIKHSMKFDMLWRVLANTVMQHRGCNLS